MILDHRGRPIPDGELKMEAKKKLEEYIQKHKPRFDDWFREKGATTFPPIKFDERKREWIWFGD